MLIHYAFLRYAPLRDDYIFDQDGAPAYNYHPVGRYSDNKRPENWIGRGGPADWLARSHDFPVGYSVGIFIFIR